MLLDAKNAFNSAPWNVIKDRLVYLGVPKYLQRILASYLRNREILVPTTEGTRTVKLSCGVPQGSILGPTLWTILYDGVLRIRMPRECTCIAYADDLAVLVKADSVEMASARAEDAYCRIEQWTRANGITLEPTKTEAILIRGKRRDPEVTLNLKGHNCQTTRKAK